MKQRIISVLLMAAIVLSVLCGCEEKETPDFESQTQLSKIKSICQLSTLECYYHNVAKSNKSKASGLAGLLQKDRVFWVEYDGVVELGLNFEKIEVEADGSTITISLPDAEILSIRVDPASYNADSIIMSQGGIINENKILSGDVNLAVASAQEEMQSAVLANTSLMELAKNRAKSMIENYINQLAEAAGLSYTIVWKDI